MLTDSSFPLKRRFDRRYHRLGTRRSIPSDAVAFPVRRMVARLRPPHPHRLPDGTFTLGAHDTLGRRISATDAEGNATHYAYDRQGRLIAVTDALGGIGPPFRLPPVSQVSRVSMFA